MASPSTPVSTLREAWGNRPMADSRVISYLANQGDEARPVDCGRGPEQRIALRC